MTRLTIRALREQLAQAPTPAFLAMLAADPRKGARQLWQHYQREQEKLAAKKAAFHQRERYERQLWPQYPNIAGIDEVGRGPLAGPVVTAAVILPHDFALLDVNDSKQLRPALRLKLYHQILEQAVAIGVGVSDVAVIDQINILEATKRAMLQAVANLPVHPDYLLIDAVKLNTPIPRESMFKGDANSVSIGAASIVAKVIRDQLMVAYDRAYPGYDFAQNAGYGTAKHLAGLAKYGVSPAHRQSFAPVRQYL